MPEINTMNDFMISSNGANLVPLLSVNIVTRDQALRTAAWLVALCDILPNEGDERLSFEQVLEAVNNT